MKIRGRETQDPPPAAPAIKRYFQTPIHVKDIILVNDLLNDTLREIFLTNNTLNTNAHITNDTRSGKWRSHRQEDAPFGSTFQPRRNFIANSYTLINLNPDQDGNQTTLDDINHALAFSTEPTRTVMITQTYSDTKTNTHTIITIHEKTIELYQNFPLHPKTRTLNRKPIYITITEKGNTLPYDIDTLSVKLTSILGRGNFNIHTPTNYAQPQTTPLGTIRNPITKYPSQIWYREIPKARPQARKRKLETPKDETPKRKTPVIQSNQPNNSYNKQTLEEHNKILGALGILPRNFRYQLYKLGKHEEDIDKRAIEKIKAISFEGLLKTFRRTEKWKKKRKERNKR